MMATRNMDRQTAKRAVKEYMVKIPLGVYNATMIMQRRISNNKPS